MLNTILLATTNRKKIVELRPSFSDLGVELLSLSEMPNRMEVDETGSTFIENARLKAMAQAKHYGIPALGEDSGLCIPALGGRPGIYSARFAGIGAGDEANNDLLLDEMQQLRGERREAYYVSTMSLSDAAGNILAEAEGRCWGRIIEARRGTGGFGYDPLFEIAEYHRTFAELGLVVKNVLSHRGRALRRFLPQLRSILHSN
jgi:XTP/dITP diphosphohydrolase